MSQPESSAIRDFDGIDYAVETMGLQPSEAKFAALVKQKLAIPGNHPVDVSEPRLAELRRQLEPQLKPVLRERDFVRFDLDRAFNTVAKMVADAV